MHLSGVISAFLMLFVSTIAPESTPDTYYLLAVTSQATGGTTETLCVTIKTNKKVSLQVTLEHNQHNTTLLTVSSVNQEYYRCVTFQVPLVTVETVASIHIKVGNNLYNSTKFLITPPRRLIIIETDKPIYKPGQTVKFRIVSLDSNFFTYSQRLPTIELQDPNSNRIGQWLNVATFQGLVDLSYPLNSEATNGIYIFTVWNSNHEVFTETFEVRDYVLPTFEVTIQFPSVLTILDTSATVKVCAKYTYGKPVEGVATVVVCHNSFRYWWIMPSDSQAPDICNTYSIETDKTGCGQQVLNLTEYALADARYQSLIYIHSSVEEQGTGVIMKGSATSSITTEIFSLTFEDSPSTYKPGMPYNGKIKMTDQHSEPLKNQQVNLTITYNNGINSIQLLVTNDLGICEFSLDTTPWGLESVLLMAKTEKSDTPFPYVNNQLTPYYPAAYLWLQPFYSKSRSFIELKSSSAPFSCNKDAKIEAQYVIHDKLKPSVKTIYFYYLVMSRGHLYQQGQQTVYVTPGKVIRGKLTFTLLNVKKLPPFAQVVLYTILSSGETLADSRTYPVELCLNNKVSLNFTSPSELPGSKTSLTLKAAPGSLCSVKAIDKSLLLLKPDAELTIESVFNMLPVQMLYGYPYNVYDDNFYPCRFYPPIFFRGSAQKIRYFPYYGNGDVYAMFRDIGVKIATNTDITNTSACYNHRVYEMGANIGGSDSVEKESANSVAFSVKPTVTVRVYFPEAWIWSLVSVSRSGVKIIDKTVPDSITTWQAEAFCTSPVGFGVAPKTELTAFQPFFVSLTMPSSVIRGEVFTLKATVFNYLKSCMMVKVTLAASKQFRAETCEGCVYTFCLCADQSWTVSWTITPLVLGKVTINVTAEAIKSPRLCGKKEVFVPQKGNIDTIIKTLKVQAEGTKQYKTYNELLCTSGGTVGTTVSLTLPNIIVEDSAVASVSVVGDLMGRALQNLASLLAMPYGCGEQNMLRFAPNIFIMQYLESTNQLTPAIRSTAETYLVSGYQGELNYKHTDGSYSAFGMSDPSGNTWLTAFVMKSFGHAKRYIFIDQVFVDQAKTWLGQRQQANGCFASVGQLFHTDMKGGVNDEVTLSAYIAAAMLELNYTVTDPVVNNSLTCLKNAYAQVNSTYAKALLFYTFTLAGDHDMRSTLMSTLDSQAIVSGGGRHWSRTNDGSVTDSLEVEITSYVLLALISGPQLSGFDLSYSASIVRWLSQQQNAFGGFASTQDTVVALQALAKYSLATYSPAGSLTVTITSPSGQIITFTITQSNRLLYQERQLEEVSGDYTVSGQGTGCAYVQFTLRYNIPPPPDRSSFIISASASGNCRVPNHSLEVTINVMYNGPRRRTNMVVIEVSPLSGFRADKNTVKLVNSESNSADGAVRRVDQNEDSVIIYLDGLTKGIEKQYTLTIVQDHSVQNLRPAIVKVYDYYETSDAAVTEYPSPCIVQ